MVALGIEPGTSGSVGRNSDHLTIEAVLTILLRTYLQIRGKEWKF
jgi:hypothetical protein